MVWVALLAFAIPVAASPHPVAYIIMVGLVTAMIDIGSYFVGRGFGRRPLAPILSPNKTVEGFFGGVVAAVVTAAVLSTCLPYEDLGFAGSVILALILALIGPVGDLAESMVKRSLGVKDMGSVLPGHGGMLDRIDSFLFAVPCRLRVPAAPRPPLTLRPLTILGVTGSIGRQTLEVAHDLDLPVSGHRRQPALGRSGLPSPPAFPMPRWRWREETRRNVRSSPARSAQTGSSSDPRR
jgi:hypothetical protein